MKRQFEGIWIPKEVYLDTQLNWVEKILLVEVRSLSTTDQGCFASNKHFANHLQRQPSTVSNIISRLIEKGYLTATYEYKDNSPEIDKRYLKVSDSYFKDQAPEEAPRVTEIRNDVSPAFEVIWDLYQKKVGDKTKLKRKWSKLSQTDRDLAYAHIPEYVKSTEKLYRLNLATYLNNSGWTNEIIKTKNDKTNHEKDINYDTFAST